MRTGNKTSNLRLTGSIFYLLIKHDKKYAFITMFICALVGLATSGNVWLKQLFFESVQALGDGGKLDYAIIMGILWGGITLFTLLLQGVSDVMTEDLGIKLRGIIESQVNEKASKLKLISFEDAKILNHVNKAYEGVEHMAEITHSVITLLVFYTPYFLFFAIYTYRIHPALCFGILLVLVPTMVGQQMNANFYAKLEDKSAPIRRQMDYYQSCMVSREYAKETRLLGAVWFFRVLYEEMALVFKKEKWKTNRLCAFMELGIRGLSLLVYILILVLMYRYLKLGYMNVAAFAAILTSIDQMFNSMDYVTYNLGDLSQYLPSMSNTLQFLSMSEEKYEEVEINAYPIEIKNVSFQYPYNNKCVINKVSVKINEGETIAVVGENGSGKSTLVKLIMGLYEPTDGDILINGYNTKKITNESIFKNATAVFQDFQKYKMLLKDNIVISQPSLEPDEKRLQDAIDKAELSINNRSFNNGYETMLSREFDGVDLSGGQWQRVAIGRGLYKNHALIVLDEPTAAIDPIEETKLYKQFIELSKDKTAIIVTHRLGSARIADRIIVLKQGQIDDIGTHEELLNRGGTYKEMYQSQAQWYR